jgi:hypothetical protein
MYDTICNKMRNFWYTKLQSILNFYSKNYRTVYTRKLAYGLSSKILDISPWAYLANKIFFSEIRPIIFGLMRPLK